MNVKIFRKNDAQEYIGVTKLKIEKKGWLFPRLYVDAKFGEGASSHYVGKDHDVAWKFDYRSNPGMGMDYCKRVEVQSSDTTARDEM